MSEIVETAPPLAQGASRRARGGPALPTRDPLKTFSRRVAVPAVLVYVAICGLVLLTLSLMTSEINRIDGNRGERAIAAALESFVYQLREQVVDESTWTEAYLNTSIAMNPAWLDSTWGTTARADGHYDSVLVTDAGGSIMFGESVRGPLAGAIAEHYSAAPSMIDRLGGAIAEQGYGAAIGSFASTPSGPAAIATAVIHGTANQLTIAVADRRMLWLAKRIDDAMLEEIAGRFQVPAPRLLLSGDALRDGEQRLELTDEAGNAVAELAWRPLRPGDMAFTSAVSAALFLLFIIGAMVFAVLRAFRRSIQKRAESDERDWRSARYDSETGLVNRFGLEEGIVAQLSRRDAGVQVGIACIEFDGLKDVAGYYGQETAVALLAHLGDLVDHALDGDARIARIGPDQFALCRTGEGAGSLVGEDCEVVMELLAEAIALGDLRLKLSASIGIAEAGVTRDSVGAVFTMAATALQRARETGGNHMVAYDASLAARREQRLAMQADIRRGLDGGEFDLDYQPIFDFSTQSLSGVEALLRWPRHRGGPLSPGEFIPAAEASGLIEELGMFALRRACEDMAALPGIKLSVNVSTVQFRSPTLANQIGAILRATDFPAERLQLEITESFLLSQPERARTAIEDLRGRGIAIALDDFGTGFSSVGYLRQFSFDRVKLDRSLIADIDSDPVKLALVESTLIYAFAMGLSVTAEGVERREEAATLTRLGCTEFQGFLFSRPLGRSALERLLNQPAAARQVG